MARIQLDATVDDVFAAAADGTTTSSAWADPTKDAAQARSRAFEERLALLSDETVEEQVGRSQRAWKGHVFRTPPGDWPGTKVTLSTDLLSTAFRAIGTNLHPNVPRLFTAVEAGTYVDVFSPEQHADLSRVTRSYRPARKADGSTSWATLSGIVVPGKRPPKRIAIAVRDAYRKAQTRLVRDDLLMVKGDTLIALRANGSGDPYRVDESGIVLPATFWTNGWHAVLDGRELYSYLVLVRLTGAHKSTVRTGLSDEIRLPKWQRDGGMAGRLQLRIDSERYQAFLRLADYGLIQQVQPAVMPYPHPIVRRGAKRLREDAQPGQPAAWAVVRDGLSMEALDVVRPVLTEYVRRGPGRGPGMAVSFRYPGSQSDPANSPPGPKPNGTVSGADG